MIDNMIDILERFGVKMPDNGWSYTTRLVPGVHYYKQKVYPNTYSYNSGKYVVGYRGDVYFVFEVPGFESLLQKSNYTQSGDFVLFANGEIPIGETFLTWRRAEKNANEVWREYYIDKSLVESKIRMGRGLKSSQIKAIEKLTMPIDGKTIQDIFGNIFIVGGIEDIDRPNYAGSYNYHKGLHDNGNGTFIIVMPDGMQRVGPRFDELEKIIRESGFERKNIPVPLANGERFVDEPDEKQWRILKQQKKDETEKKYISISIDAARKRMGKDLTKEQMEIIEQLTICIDGQETKKKEDKLPKMNYPINVMERAQMSGKYNYENETYVIVMPDGSRRVGPRLVELEKVIKASGFQKVNIKVPLANGESIVDSVKNAEKWDRLISKKRKEIASSAFYFGVN